jgi:hypothetical protein
LRAQGIELGLMLSTGDAVVCLKHFGPPSGLILRGTGRSALKPATGDLHSADRAMRCGGAFSFWRLLQRRFFRGP